MGSVNKRDLAKAVAVHSDVDLSTVSRVLDGFTDVVTAVVSKGESVLMTGFAKFVKVERAARMGRNPATGEQIRIKASKRARIAPAKTFKDAVLSPSRAPKLARGVWPLDAEAVKRAGQSDAAISPMKKAPAKKAPAKKAPAKRAPAKRAPAKKAPAKKAPAKKAPAKKAPAKKAVAPQKTGGMRTVARKR
jgi:DNA-binding protein HU-beta